MADAIFEEPRLAEICDELDPDRSDLDAYAAMAGEFGAESVLDVGCGTGTLACLLAGRGLEVIAVDPAAACLEVARRKPGADDVRWVHGDVTDLPPLQVDLVTMTATSAARARSGGRYDHPDLAQAGCPRLDQRVSESSLTGIENSSSEQLCEFWHGTGFRVPRGVRGQCVRGPGRVPGRAA